MAEATGSRTTLKDRIRRHAPGAAAAVRSARRTAMAAAGTLLPKSLVVAAHYRARTGRWPDLSAPRDFSEKLLASKLCPPSALEVQCADKIAVRRYVEERVGEDHLIPVLLTTYSVADVGPEKIRAPSFVIKTNHDSGTVLVCRDRRTVDWPAVRRLLRRRMRLNFYYDSLEPQYRPIRPGIIVESMLQADAGRDIVDYKIYCFHGEPTLVQVDLDRSTRHMRAFFDPVWTRLDMALRYPPPIGEVARPAALDEMLDCARRLAAPFAFVRVDLYEAAGRVWFGELTFRPEAAVFRFDPPHWERRLGDLLGPGVPRHDARRAALGMQGASGRGSAT